MTIVDVKQAVGAAMEYFSSLMTVYDIRLEEVETSNDERFWYITLSGLVAVRQPPPAPFRGTLTELGNLFKNDFERIYRVFTVDAADGIVRSMKIRTLVE